MESGMRVALYVGEPRSPGGKSKVMGQPTIASKNKKRRCLYAYFRQGLGEMSGLYISEFRLCVYKAAGTPHTV